MTYFAFVLLLLLPASASARARYAEPSASRAFSPENGAAPAVQAKKTRFPLIVYGEQKGVLSGYVPSGYMGDSDALKMVAAKISAPVRGKDAGANALKVQYGKGSAWPYRVPGAGGWAGVFWLAPANNWAKIKGAGYDLSSASRLSFWAKGERGGEVISSVKIGGIVGPYPDTGEASIGPIKLTPDWQRFDVDLTGKDFRHIVGGFSFSVRRVDNPRGAVFYLDEIVYQAEEEAAPAPAAALPEASPAPAASTQKIVIPFPTLHALSLDETERELAKVIAIANARPEARLTIEGHTDDVGSSERNLTVAFEQAKLVADHLEQNGIASDRLTVSGLGETKPLAPGSNKTRQGRLRNRRVEITIETR